MDLRRVMFALVAVLGTVGPLPAATASPVVYYFSGTFQQLSGTAPAALAGSAFAGIFTYDTSAVVDVAGPTTLTYAPGSASVSVQTVLGGGQTTAGAGRIQSVWDATIATSLGGLFSPGDEFAAGATASFDAALSVFSLLTLQFVDGTGGAADDPFGAPLSAPPSVLSLSEIDAAELRMVGTGIVNGNLQVVATAIGAVSCLSTVPAQCGPATTVPEPHALLLAATALFALCAARRRRPHQ